MKTIGDIPAKKRAEPFPGIERVFKCSIKALRTQKGLTLRAVEKHSGVKNSTICRAEAGLRIELDAAIRLAQFFETAVEKLWVLK